MHPPPLPAAAKKEVEAKSRSMQFALSFLLGGLTMLAAVKLYQGRLTRPLETQPRLFHVDLNGSSVNELAQLPRIGTARAQKIVESRPFESVEDLQRVNGIGPMTLEKVRPHVKVGEPDASRSSKPLSNRVIDPNQASLEDLQTLPGIGPKMAQRIIDERAKRPFTSVEDLRRVSGIGPKTLEKLRDRIEIRLINWLTDGG